VKLNLGPFPAPQWAHFLLWELDEPMVCHQCKREISFGQPYDQAVPHTWSSKGQPGVMLICVYCAYPPLEKK